MADAVQASCKHLRAKLRGGDRFGYGTCPDCGAQVRIYVPINNLLIEMRKALGIPEAEVLPDD